MYIDEAHAVDLWPIGTQAGCFNKTHKRFQDRLECAARFYRDELLGHCTDEGSLRRPMAKWSWDLYVDRWSGNDFKESFYSWPMSMTVIDNFSEKVAYVARADKDGQFDFKDWLRFFDEQDEDQGANEGSNMEI